MKQYVGICPNCSRVKRLYGDCGADTLEVFCEDCEIMFEVESKGLQEEDSFLPTGCPPLDVISEE